MSADVLRVVLVVYLVLALGSSLFYLRGRQLPTVQRLAWAALAVCLPALGPFVVIAARPGTRVNR